MKKRGRDRSDMPSQKKIFKHWQKLLQKYGREIPTERTCFACLREGAVQRCHIDALCDGGTNDVKNLHLLCPNCHVESESYTSEFYWIWFENKDLVFLPLYRNIEKANLAIKFGELIKQRLSKEYQNLLKNANPAELVKLYDKILEQQKVAETKINDQKKLF